MANKQTLEAHDGETLPCPHVKPCPPRCTYRSESDLPGCSSSSEQIAESDQEKQAEAPDRQESSEIHDIPDGGTTAWLVVLGAWCVSFCSYGWINSELSFPRTLSDSSLTDKSFKGIGTFQAYYQSGPLSSYSASTISWIPSLQIFFMSVLGPVIGHVYDRYGMRFLVLGGSLMHVFGLMMASISTEYYQFLLSQGVCSAIGVAVVFLSAISAVTGWFHKRRGLAFGILSTGSSLGGVVFPIMLTRLIDSIGYGWAMRTCAFIIMGLLVVANLTLKTRQKPTRRSLPRGHMWRPFRELPFVLLLVGLFLVPFGLYIPIDYLPVASMGAGMGKELAQNLVAFYNAARYGLHVHSFPNVTCVNTHTV